ncbi:ATP-binding protein [Archangium primigenium]|uniref:ATP-binding protein n=1 Tax=[Archangium] primigenium TaxID=2792470 RepID=UPI00308413CD
MLALALVYLASTWLSLTQAALSGGASVVCVSAGVALAGLYRLGPARWPALFVASVLVQAVSSSLSPAAVLLVATGDTLSALLGAWLLKRWGFSAALSRVRDVWGLALVAAASPSVGVLGGVLGGVLSGALGASGGWAAGGMALGVEWLGRTLGVLGVGSVLMWCAQRRPEPSGREGLVLAFITFAMCGGALLARSQTPVYLSTWVFFLLPVGVWVAWRFGSRLAACCLVLFAGASAWTRVPEPAAVFTSVAGAGRLLEPRLFLVIAAFGGLLLLAARAERGLSHTQLEVLTTALKGVQEGVLVAEQLPGREPRLVFANASLLEMGGWRIEELLGQSPFALWGDTLDPALRERLADALRERTPLQAEVVMTHRDGSRVYSQMQLSFVRSAGGASTFLVSTHRDITTQKRLQAQLVSAERIAAVGTLAAGVGHEINNPLAYLLLNLEGAMRSLKKGPEHMMEARTRLECVREGAERIRVIARDLKVFSRQEGEEREMLDVNEVVVPALRMAAHAVRARARLVEDFGSPPLVSANESRLGQVLLNLLVNALQSIPEGHPDRHEVRVRTGVDSLGRALVEISDTGCGMAPHVLERIFDPFFTTKPSGEGTGLGLAICQQIVQSHGGELQVRSEQGKGSVFTLVLPAAPPTDMVAPEADEAAAHVAESPRRRRILVIDDEPRLAQSMRMLIEPSHDVVVTTRGAEALAWVSAGQRFDLVLCDLQMPGTTGMDVYSHLTAHAPELLERLVFISGGAYTQATRDFVRSVRNRILEKPVRPDELLATIDEALATSTAA